MLIVGCGYLGRKIAGRLEDPSSLWGLVRSEQSAQALTQMGVQPLIADIDSEIGTHLPTADEQVFYLAPPPASGQTEPRIRNFLSALNTSGQPRRLVYISTTGIYGDCHGNWVDENHPVAPTADRARRRWDAEQQLRAWHKSGNGELVILRVAGIYGPGKLPLERLRKRRPMIEERLAPWTNRIHVDDLVTVCLTAMSVAPDGEIYNVSDGHPGNMMDYFNQVADLTKLPRPPIISPGEARSELSPGLLSYLQESRRIDNRKMLRELGIRLKYPTLTEGLPACLSDEAAC